MFNRKKIETLKKIKAEIEKKTNSNQDRIKELGLLSLQIPNYCPWCRKVHEINDYREFKSISRSSKVLLYHYNCPECFKECCLTEQAIVSRLPIVVSKSYKNLIKEFLGYIDESIINNRNTQELIELTNNQKLNPLEKIKAKTIK